MKMWFNILVGIAAVISAAGLIISMTVRHRQKAEPDELNKTIMRRPVLASPVLWSYVLFFVVLFGVLAYMIIFKNYSTY